MENNIQIIQNQVHRIPKLRKIRASSWNVAEQISYVQFLKKSKHLMNSTVSRKANVIFKRMAAAVRTRNMIQAKTHHQKMENRYRTIPRIILEVTNNIRPRLADESQSKQVVAEQGMMIIEAAEDQIVNGERDIVEEVDYLSKEVNERLILASYCSFFDEYSENYGLIEEGSIIQNDFFFFESD